MLPFFSSNSAEAAASNSMVRTERPLRWSSTRFLSIDRRSFSRTSKRHGLEENARMFNFNVDPVVAEVDCLAARRAQGIADRYVAAAKVSCAGLRLDFLSADFDLGF